MAVEKKWDDLFILEAYRLAREGLSNDDMATSFNVAPSSFTHWLRTKPAFKEAIRQGKEKKLSLKKQGKTDLQEYIFQRLPEDLQELWDRIELNEALGFTSIDWLKQILIDRGEAARKQLFLYSLTVSSFNPSLAMKQIGVEIIHAEMLKRARERLLHLPR